MKSYRALLAGLSLLTGLGLFLAQPFAAAAEKAGGANAGQWGTIKGQVVFGGDTIPEPEKIDVNKDQDHCLSRGPLYSQKWVINKDNKGVRWVFVWLLPDPESGVKKLPINPELANLKDTPAVMDQPCCQFEPHCLGVQEGQVLIFKNSAPIAHNVNYTGGAKNPGNNLLLSPDSKTEVKNLVANRLPVTVSCNIHPWMHGWVRVFDNPYYAVTDANGAFEIKGAPAGTYRVVVWHETVGWLDKPEEKEIDGNKVRILGRPITITADKVNDLGKLEVHDTAK